MSSDDFETEPIPGLPAHLPEGEHIVWQGYPDERTVARKLLHERKIMAYFVVLIAWKFGTGLYDGETVLQSLYVASSLALGALIVFTLIRWYARAIRKSTIYTLTNKRVVMRFGVALPVTFNFPFKQITEANFKTIADDKGTISLGLTEHTKISWLILWPHVRPWMISRPQPAMRMVRNVDQVAALLSKELHAFHSSQSPTVRVIKTDPAQQGPEPTPAIEFEKQGA
ncbi:MAG: photosynthetic complex putative assembly protein PuhB [Pseudomonadota bacterium]